MKKVSTIVSLAIVAATTAGMAHAKDKQKALLAGGCFWCMESDFEKVDGVLEAVSGYTGGDSKNPTYKTIGKHFEAVEIYYDADKVSYEELIHLYFRSIDPVDAEGQFCDRGDSYRTAVFALNDEQRKIAEAEIARINNSGVLPAKIVTPVVDATKFYKAEAYHQDYYKSQKIVLTRFGPLTKEKAYKRYRTACGRDARVKELWGSEAFGRLGS